MSNTLDRKPRGGRATLRWSVAVVATLATLSSVAGMSTAQAATTPSPEPLPTLAATTESPSADPSAEATSDPTAEPTDTPSTESTDLPTPTESAEAGVQAAVEPPRDNYSPPDGMLFNNPFTSAKWIIRTHTIRAIKSVPAGGSIKIATFAVNDGTLVDELLLAKNRGVAVQVISDAHVTKPSDDGYSPPFLRLRKALGSSSVEPGVPMDRASWAKTCNRSCRGNGGNLHQKLMLFSSAGAKTNITMVGSHNPTLRAVVGQFNHMMTYSDAATYNAYSGIFEEMRQDRWFAAKDITTSAVRSLVWPRPSTNAGNDPMVAELNKVRCTGATGGAGAGGRTVIRIGQYAWYQSRGTWLAKKVRSLWNQGCNVAIEYAISSNATRKILYSSAGRGRIPMRRIASFKRDGSVKDYTHAKYMTISGNFGGDTSQWVTWQGTTNWSNLGMYSDEMNQRWFGKAVSDDFMADFSRVWRSRISKTPSPVSRSTVSSIQLGEGKLAAMTTD